MLNRNPAKTKSAPESNRHHQWVLVLITSCVLVILLAMGWWISRSDEPTYARLAADERLAVAGRQYELQRADTEAERAVGLSNRDGMPVDQGMIFVFQRSGQQCFWMKDTRFDLDMIWLNAKREVTHIATYVSPSSYPKTFCAEGQYVIELRAGQAVTSRITVGQHLNW